MQPQILASRQRRRERPNSKESTRHSSGKEEGRRNVQSHWSDFCFSQIQVCRVCTHATITVSLCSRNSFCVDALRKKLIHYLNIHISDASSAASVRSSELCAECVSVLTSFLALCPFSSFAVVPLALAKQFRQLNGWTRRDDRARLHALRAH